MLPQKSSASLLADCCAGRINFLGGLTLGAGLHNEYNNGFVIGGEFSLVYFSPKASWIGGYNDLIWDFGSDSLRYSIGPEFGIGPFGLDGGYLVSVRNEVLQQGFQVRLLLTVGSFAFYSRWGRLFGETLSGQGIRSLTQPLKYETSVIKNIPSRHFGEIGILIKPLHF
jgi:hypothetical protein